MMNLGKMVKGIENDVYAKELIKFWKYDEGTLKLCRASSNFVYSFENNKVKYFLRISLEQDKSIEEIKAELDFMKYLKSNGFKAVSPIESVNKELIETLKTEEGTYFAVVFSEAKGINLDEETVTEKHMREWGKSLASLHCLSKDFEFSGNRRADWNDTINFMEAIFRKNSVEELALKELSEIRNWLQSLPNNKDIFGLIHYDFQLDNIFFEEDKDIKINVIDFDDSMYHWYALDIVTALDDFIGENSPESKLLIEAFLEGYRSEKDLDNCLVSQFDKFKRYANLYKFARILKSLDYEKINNAPEWLEPLDLKLISIANKLREGFKKSQGYKVNY